MIREISALETYAVRQPVLRPGKPAESCLFEGDSSPSTKHFGFYDGEKLVGIVSLFESVVRSFQEKNQFQIRGMAVLASHQKKGIGEQLMQHIESELRKERPVFLWFNARESAVGFYRKLGYETVGNPFDIGDIGTHYIMCKKFAKV
jgi:GNAT superfamily N-acetyltransferase